jgi:hypothetical protein
LRKFTGGVIALHALGGNLQFQESDFAVKLIDGLGRQSVSRLCGEQLFSHRVRVSFTDSMVFVHRRDILSAIAAKKCGLGIATKKLVPELFQCSRVRVATFGRKDVDQLSIKTNPRVSGMSLVIDRVENLPEPRGVGLVLHAEHALESLMRIDVPQLQGAESGGDEWEARIKVLKERVPMGLSAEDDDGLATLQALACVLGERADEISLIFVELNDVPAFLERRRAEIS